MLVMLWTRRAWTPTISATSSFDPAPLTSKSHFIPISLHLNFNFRQDADSQGPVIRISRPDATWRDSVHRPSKPKSDGFADPLTAPRDHCDLALKNHESLFLHPDNLGSSVFSLTLKQTSSAHHD